MPAAIPVIVAVVVAVIGTFAVSGFVAAARAGPPQAGDTSSGEPSASGGSSPGRTHRTTGADRDRRRGEVKEAHERAIARQHEARAAESEAKHHLDELNREASELQSELGMLTGEERSATDRVAAARRNAREYAVEAYVGGGPPSFSAYFLNATNANDLAWKSWMVRDHVGRAFAAVDDLAEVRATVGDRVDDLARRLDDNRAARQAAQNDLQRASDEVLRVEDELATAEQDRREADEEAPIELFEVRGFRGAGDDGSPTPDQSGNARGPGWAALRQCESSGNYNIVDASGTYRGAYQFDLPTWRSVGGHGDPIDNTTAEQDLRAQLLYDSRGAQPWPICGRHLRAPIDRPPTQGPPPDADPTTPTTPNPIPEPGSTTTSSASSASSEPN